MTTGPAVPARRAWLGLAVAAAGLAGLTAMLAPARLSVSLASVALLYLVPVVGAAVIGGLRPALAAAVAADLLVNFFFIPPYHTLVVDRRDNVLALVVYVLVAAVVSVAVEVAARQRERAARRDVEAALLARAAMHGTLTPTETPGGGLTMTVTLPIPADATGTRP